MSDKKRCFVICPIGQPGTETRKRADDLFEYLIEPVVGPRGYHAERADKLNQTGIITTQIVQHLVEDDLVIADLTGHNPNVFYELAIRHVTQKTVIPIIASDEDIPFDVKPVRTITIDHRDVRSIEEGKATLGKYVDAADDDSSKHNPVSVAAASLKIQSSGDPSNEIMSQMLAMLSDLKSYLLPRANYIPVPSRIPSAVRSEKKYLSLEEAAAVMNMTPSELIRVRERGEIRGFADRGVWKFKSDDVKDFLFDKNSDVRLADDGSSVTEVRLVKASDSTNAESPKTRPSPS
jgi:hypothetical protein